MYVFRSHLLVIDKWPLPHMVLVTVTALPPNPTTAYVEPKQTRSEQGQLLRARERPGAPIWRAVYGEREKQAASTKQSPIKDVCAHPFYLFCRTTKMNWTLLTKKIFQTKILIQCRKIRYVVVLLPLCRRYASARGCGLGRETAWSAPLTLCRVHSRKRMS